jgi:hypothetical protein
VEIERRELHDLLLLARRLLQRRRRRGPQRRRAVPLVRELLPGRARRLVTTTSKKGDQNKRIRTERDADEKSVTNVARTPSKAR